MSRDAVRIDVDGARQLRRDLRRMGDDLAELKDAHAAAAALVAAEAGRRAPKRTGRLAGSVRGNRALSRATVSAGRASIPYAGPIHWGWAARGIEANPFVADAATATEPAWVELYVAGIDRATDRIAGNTY